MYRRVVSVAAAARNRDRDHVIVAAILRDTHEMAARTAVVHLVDEVAMRATGPAEFREWAADLLPQLDRLRTEGNREFIRRRVHDWLFYLSIRDGHVPAPAELAAVTDWMQRLLAEKSTSPSVLGLLAQSGGTRKIRNLAKHRAGSRTLGTS
ncbi:hypothetical protein [Actinophytocola algeriensis]|uniref:Uncharacterized protein n=1 Tax=Actinophytocola algeriensis TaxID=1768010 RepID=A0A7W7Q7Z9_9PSEU|nr:hypothetical protein [Actinophytocola algeriensis]MBB4908720.1 hypothetical protein [Actinophytocola algeriensis]MBE1474893.1 hypothetical protein [Actinophytocola algeriensis]